MTDCNREVGEPSREHMRTDSIQAEDAAACNTAAPAPAAAGEGQTAAALRGGDGSAKPALQEAHSSSGAARGGESPAGGAATQTRAARSPRHQDVGDGVGSPTAMARSSSNGSSSGIERFQTQERLHGRASSRSRGDAGGAEGAAAASGAAAAAAPAAAAPDIAGGALESAGAASEATGTPEAATAAPTAGAPFGNSTAALAGAGKAKQGAGGGGAAETPSSRSPAASAACGKESSSNQNPVAEKLPLQEEAKQQQEQPEQQHRKSTVQHQQTEERDAFPLRLFESYVDYQAAAVPADPVTELVKCGKLASVLSRRGSAVQISDKPGDDDGEETATASVANFESRKSLSSPGLSPAMLQAAAAEADIKSSTSSPSLLPASRKGEGEGGGENDEADAKMFAAVPAPPRGTTVSATTTPSGGPRNSRTGLPSNSVRSRVSSFWGHGAAEDAWLPRVDFLDSEGAKPTAAPPTSVQIKVVIYGGVDMEGKKLYCKFYHGSCKHKTSVAATRENPEWREWFLIDVPQQQATGAAGGGRVLTPLRSRQHSSSRDPRSGGVTNAGNETTAGHPSSAAAAEPPLPPMLRIEVWGSSFLGREVKGFCDIDLTPVLHEYLLIDGLYTVYGPAGGRLRVKLINMSLLPRWERTAAAEAALRMAGEEDPDGVLAMIVDDLKRMFLCIPYTTIVQVLRDVDWRKHNAFEVLSAMRAEKRTFVREGRKKPALSAAAAMPVNIQNGAQHDSFLHRKRQQLVRDIARMLPDVDLEEIEYTLKLNDYDICATVEDLILAHRETTQTLPAFGDELRAIKLASKAEAGGFVALESQGNMMHVRHSSAMPPDREGVGLRKFRQRVLMFERGKTLANQAPEK